MLAESYPLYLGGRAHCPNLDLEVYDKYTGELATRVPLAGPDLIEAGIAAAHASRAAMASLPAWKRKEVLLHCARRFAERRDELALALCIEAGKPIRDARGEVSRLIDTFQVAAEESVRMVGEVLPLDISARAEGYSGMWKRVPLGPLSFISPFNFPLNLAAHKIAPAIAVGCPFVLKPASMTPVGALLIGSVLAETDLPEGSFSILPARRDGADLFTTDERLKLLSFTGSPEVGWALKARAGKKKVVLELGGNAACIVDADADLDDAVARIVVGAFYQSGQSCIGVQRILVHQSVYPAFKDCLLAATAVLETGDPRQETTFVGPMISEAEAVRVQRWVDEACALGARLLCGGQREGALLSPTLLEDVPRSAAVYCREVFGPVALLSPFADFDDALDEVNDSDFGLQAGVFTRDLYKARRAWDRLEVGGVVIGDIPSWRVDHMPYGGVKDSGLGREGLRYAMEDMSEIRLMVVRTPPAER
ncbi:MAG: aldehyde dehydrogenase [Rickettsiales bacterium]|nr:aldehyde dehydrogenase [Rickettsiales bacterium]|tara:strand:+ start:1626 stop:3065 length:1440 start_codon:yes stop_codon:yes gene_type:complete